jgi:predicted flap endonuclease-1-like 5' DNA nuclease
MALRIDELFGVREDLSAKLKAEGLNDSDKLLAAATTPKAREELAAKLGVDSKEILELANRSDLARIKGVGTVYSDLLEWAGVDTVAELARRNPDNLFNAIVEAANEHFVKRLPRTEDVASWVAQAKELPRMLQY